MRSEFLAVWPFLQEEVLCPLADSDKAPEDLYCELARELARALLNPPSFDTLSEIASNPKSGEAFLRNVRFDELKSERAVIDFIESTHTISDDVSDMGLAADFFDLIEGFVEKYNLRYSVTQPLRLCPTLPGLFATLAQTVDSLAREDAHLSGLLNDFETSLGDLRIDLSDSRIRTCMVRQVNLLEALASRHPKATKKTISEIADEVPSWPHNALKRALKSVYGFTSDYPGIRHGGTPESALRQIDMRDMLASSILLLGFVPYFSVAINAENVYHGSSAEHLESSDA